MHISISDGVQKFIFSLIVGAGIGFAYSIIPALGVGLIGVWIAAIGLEVIYP